MQLQIVTIIHSTGWGKYTNIINHEENHNLKAPLPTNYTYVMFKIINIVKDIWDKTGKNMQITEEIWSFFYLKVFVSHERLSPIPIFTPVG